MITFCAPQDTGNLPTQSNHPARDDWHSDPSDCHQGFDDFHEALSVCHQASHAGCQTLEEELKGLTPGTQSLAIFIQVQIKILQKWKVGLKALILISCSGSPSTCHGKRCSA
jgi:hypothetical protein